MYISPIEWMIIFINFCLCKITIYSPQLKSVLNPQSMQSFCIQLLKSVYVQKGFADYQRVDKCHGNIAGFQQID